MIGWVSQTLQKLQTLQTQILIRLGQWLSPRLRQSVSDASVVHELKLRDKTVSDRTPPTLQTLQTQI